MIEDADPGVAWFDPEVDLRLELLPACLKLRTGMLPGRGDMVLSPRVFASAIMGDMPALSPHLAVMIG